MQGLTVDQGQQPDVRLLGRSLGGQRQHELVDALGVALPLAHRHRPEGSQPVTRGSDLDGAEAGTDSLGPAAVARVAADALGRAVVLSIAQVIDELGLQRSLEHRARHGCGQAFAPRPRPVRATPGTRGGAGESCCAHAPAPPPDAAVPGSMRLLGHLAESVIAAQERSCNL